ncbi:hypothetical protein CTAYLR_000497 [Chrysophaeum taylorii]|uniref:Phosphate transporter n=1 Tax=Chrysophaeum taylorii TaxID=2483200 RepID=A0AAD7XQJ4_9STRA|nr:hypothetical protein CTAYLR_000497 [Chrysophaeum taylorii]
MGWLQWMWSRDKSEAEEDYPWIWAVRDVEQLDFKIGLNPAEALTVAKRQSQMPVEILPHVFLANARTAHNVDLLRKLRVTHVLNAAGAAGRAPDPSVYRRNRITVLELDGRDEEGFPMLARYLQRSRSFIADARRSRGRVVVHCVAGLNRSGLLVAAEYMLTTRATVLDTVAHCRHQRGNLCLCNKSFQAQLVALAREEYLLGPPPGHPNSRVKKRPPPRPTPGGELRCVLWWCGRKKGACAVGANDVANAFGTSVGSGVITMRQAFAIAAVCNLLGAVSMGSAVTGTIRKGIIELRSFDDDPKGLMLAMLTAMLGSISYVASATKLGLPVSTTQSILGGLVGSMIARDRGSLGGVRWRDSSGKVCEFSEETRRASCGGVLGIVLQWVFAPVLAMALATALFGVTRAVLLRADPPVAARRAPPLMAFYLGSVAFLLAWFVIVQEKHHPTSRGWDPHDASDPIAKTTALEATVCALVGVGAAYVASIAFALRPRALYYAPYLKRRRREAGGGEVEMVPSSEGAVHEEDGGGAKEEEEGPRSFNPLTFQGNNSKGYDEDDELGAPATELSRGEVYDDEIESVFGTAQICTASLAAFAAGANDVANEVAPLAAILQTYRDARVTDTARTPRWLYLYAGAGIAVGLALFGRRVMKTIGKDAVALTPSRGFNIDSPSAPSSGSGS